jgi:hypothetical protein
MTNIVFIIFVLVTLAGCDRVVNITNDGSKKEFNLGCGKLTMEPKTMGGRYYWIYSEFDASGEITLNKNAMTIRFKGEPVSFKMYEENTEVDSHFSISGKKTLRIYFDFVKEIRPVKGDTVEFFINGGIKCKGENIVADPVYLIIEKDF